MIIKMIDSTDINIESILMDSLGEKVEFTNGCSLILVDDDGLFWGTSPYGLDWACNSNEGWVESVFRWLSYWNDDRDESGVLMSDERSF